MRIRMVLGMAILLLGTPRWVLAQGQTQIEAGQKTFADQKCAVCHSLAGQGNKNGPLDGIGSKLSADEIRQWLTNAPEMAAKIKADRKPPMKDFSSLTKEELDGLVAYLSSLKK